MKCKACNNLFQPYDFTKNKETGEDEELCQRCLDWAFDTWDTPTIEEDNTNE